MTNINMTMDHNQKLHTALVNRPRPSGLLTIRCLSDGALLISNHHYRLECGLNSTTPFQLTTDKPVYAAGLMKFKAPDGHSSIWSCRSVVPIAA